MDAAGSRRAAVGLFNELRDGDRAPLTCTKYTAAIGVGTETTWPFVTTVSANPS